MVDLPFPVLKKTCYSNFVVQKDFVHFFAAEILNLFQTNIILIKPNKYWFFALNQLVKVDSGALWLTLKNKVYIIWTVLNDLLI